MRDLWLFHCLYLLSWYIVFTNNEITTGLSSRQCTKIIDTNNEITTGLSSRQSTKTIDTNNEITTGLSCGYFIVCIYYLGTLS
jgi:hypothetical protein